MAQIYEVSTNNGKVFRVVVDNNSQYKKLLKAKSDSKGKYEEITSVKCIVSGVHQNKYFLEIAKKLV